MRRESSAERAAWTALVEGATVQKPQSQALALGRLKTGERNKTEAAYEQHLEVRKKVGEVLWYGFEAITFKLAHDCRYTPDFAVMLSSGVIECHELKGTTTLQRASGARVKAPFFRDDAKVKLKVAASIFPFVFKVVYFAAGSWVEEEV